MVVPGWGALPGRAQAPLSEVLVGTSQLWCTALSAECGDSPDCLVQAGADSLLRRHSISDCSKKAGGCTVRRKVMKCSKEATNTIR